MGNVSRENLNDEEFASLREVGNGQARTSIPEEHKKRLLELRLVKEELGNLRQTPHGVFIAGPKLDPLAGMPRGRRDR
jgi:hypothetical protein